MSIVNNWQNYKKVFIANLVNQQLIVKQLKSDLT